MTREPPGSPPKDRRPAPPGAANASIGPPRARAVDPSTRVASFEATRQFQQMIDAAPGAQANHAVAAATKRDVERVVKLAATITLHVPGGVIDDSHVEARVREVCRHVNRRQPVAHGETLKLGDEILADFVGYLGGEPFVSRSDTWLDVVTNPILPGLFEALVGSTVPNHRVIRVQLPSNYPVVEHANRVAVFAIDLKDARRREVLELDDPMLLPLLNRGVKTPRQLREQVRKELVTELALQMVEHARTLLLRELYEMCMGDDVPAALVEEEVTRRWRAYIGESLIRQGVALEDQQRSRAAFADTNTVAEARRSIWEMRICEGIATAYGIVANDEEIRKAVANVMGAEVDVERLFYNQPKLGKELGRSLRTRKATDVLLKVATVDFDAPPKLDVEIKPLTLRPTTGLSAMKSPSNRPAPIPSRPAPPRPASPAAKPGPERK